MKKILLINLILVFLEYSAAYLIKSFIIWEITNPFEWIINIPNYSSNERGMTLLCCITLQLVQISTIAQRVNEKTKNIPE